jgi:hypothetical protein
MMTRLVITLPIAVILCGATIETAAAQSCGTQVARLAQQYGLSSRGAQTGVSGANIPQNGSTVPNPATPPPPQVAARQNMATTLTAARAADQRGDTAACEALLNAAQGMAGGRP